MLLRLTVLLLLAVGATVLGFAALSSIRKEPVPTAQRGVEVRIDGIDGPAPLGAVRRVVVPAEAQTPAQAPALLPPLRRLVVELDGALPGGPAGIAVRAADTRALLAWREVAELPARVVLDGIPAGKVEVALAESPALSSGSWLVRREADVAAETTQSLLSLRVDVQPVVLEVAGADGALRALVRRSGEPAWSPHPDAGAAGPRGEFDLGRLGAGRYEVELIGAGDRKPIPVEVPGPARVRID